MDVEKEKKLLANLCHKHGISFDLRLEPPTEAKIILIKKNYFSTYIFTFKKKKFDSCFSIF